MMLQGQLPGKDHDNGIHTQSVHDMNSDIFQHAPFYRLPPAVSLYHYIQVKNT